MMRIIGFVITILEVLIIIFILTKINKHKQIYIWDERTNGFLTILICIIVIFLTFNIPFEKIFRLKFDSIDKSTSYYLWGSGLRKKIKINDKNYVVIHNERRSRTSFSLFQKKQGSWEPHRIGRSTFYKDLEIYYRKISDHDLLIFAYYISTDNKENLSYQMKDYLGHDFSVKVYDKLIPTATTTENLICYYTTVKVNSDAYNIFVNNKRVSLK